MYEYEWSRSEMVVCLTLWIFDSVLVVRCALRGRYQPISVGNRRSRPWIIDSAPRLLRYRWQPTRATAVTGTSSYWTLAGHNRVRQRFLLRRQSRQRRTSCHLQVMARGN